MMQIQEPNDDIVSFLRSHRDIYSLTQLASMLQYSKSKVRTICFKNNIPTAVEYKGKPGFSKRYKSKIKNVSRIQAELVSKKRLLKTVIKSLEEFEKTNFPGRIAVNEIILNRQLSKSLPIEIKALMATLRKEENKCS